MQNPVFREFFTERKVVAEERSLRLENNPGGLLFEAHLAAAFQNHPYGTPVVGYEEDLERLSRRDVQRYFRDYYGPNNAVVAIAGDVDPERILAWAKEYLGPIPRGETPPPVEPSSRNSGGSGGWRWSTMPSRLFASAGRSPRPSRRMDPPSTC